MLEETAKLSGFAGGSVRSTGGRAAVPAARPKASSQQSPPPRASVRPSLPLSRPSGGSVPRSLRREGLHRPDGDREGDVPTVAGAHRRRRGCAGPVPLRRRLVSVHRHSFTPFCWRSSLSSTLPFVACRCNTEDLSLSGWISTHGATRRVSCFVPWARRTVRAGLDRLSVRRRDFHSADAPSPSLSKRLLK